MEQKHYIAVMVKLNNRLRSEFKSFEEQKEKELKLASVLKEEISDALQSMSDEDFLKNCTKVRRYYESTNDKSIEIGRTYY